MTVLTSSGSTLVELEQKRDNEDLYLFPCTESQRVCWYLEQLAPGGPAHNIAVRFELTGRLQTELLERTFQLVVARHEILRTTFVLSDNVPKQLIHSASLFRMSVIDVGHLIEPGRSISAEEIAGVEARLGFDLQNAPLFRATLVRCSDDKHFLLVTMHHIISDGWSIGVLTDEIAEIYSSLAEGHPANAPELPVQYADYACWQEQWLASDQLKQQIEKLKTELDGFTPLRLATDFNRPRLSNNKGEVRSILLDRSLTDSLKSLSDEHGCTLFVTMLAAFNVIMFAESGQDDLTVRTQTAGRNNLELEPLIGWFVNSIVFRNKLDAGSSFIDFLKVVQKTVSGALGLQNVPFEKLLEAVRPGSSSDRNPPFQVNFIFQRDFVKPWSQGGIELIPIPSKSAGTFVDLNFFLVERSDGWRLSVDVNTDVFLAETGDRLIRGFESILAQIAKSPNSSISDILGSTGLMPHARRQGFSLQETEAFKNLTNAENTKLEQQLLKIWQNVLLVEEIDRDTNFFDAGGHSLLAVRMLAQVQALYPNKLQLGDLFREPTISAMARVLSSSSAQAPDGEIIIVQDNGPEKAFYMVGGDHWFRPLARHLGNDIPFVGVGFRQYGRYPETFEFEGLADQVAKTIRQTQPNGPYTLGGWCVDGALAFEASRILEREGEKIDLVVLFDVINPAYRRQYRRRPKALQRGLVRTLRLSKVAYTGEYKSLMTDFRDLTTRAARRLFGSPSSQVMDDIEHADADRYVFRRRLYEAEESYTPEPIAAPILLLRTKLDDFQASDLGWKGMSTAGLQVVEIDSDHTSMFYESEVGPLAVEVRKCLDRARARERCASVQST